MDPFFESVVGKKASSAPRKSASGDTFYDSFMANAAKRETENKKKRKDDEQRAADERKRIAAENIARNDAELKKTKDGIFSPANILGDIGRAVGDAGKAIGEGIAAPFKRIGEGTAEVIHEATGGAEKERMSSLKQQQDDINTIKSLGERMKAAKTQEEKDKLRSGISNISNISDEQTRRSQERQAQVLERTDPIKGAAAIASLGLDVITGGTLKGAKLGIDAAKGAAETGLKIASKSTARKIAEETAKGAALGSVYGAAGTAQEKGGEANIGDYATGVGLGAATGGALGGTIPAIASKLGPIAKSVFTKAAEKRAEKLGRDLTEAEANDLAERTVKALPEEQPPNRQSEMGSITITPERTVKSPTTADMGAGLPEVKPPKPFAPLDEPTIAKVSDVKAKAETTPVPEGHTRLYQTKDTSDANIISDQYFKSADEVGNFINGRSDNAELRFVDVPSDQVSSVPGKPTVFKIKDEATTPVGDTISGNAARIEARGLEKKLTEKMGDLPEYKSINMKEQAQEAANLITNNKKLAVDVIDGKANAPGNLKAQSVHQALEELAIKEGDGELLTKLAKSHVNTELSGSAQNLRIAAERDPHSAVEQIRQIRDARMKSAERRSKTTVAKEAKNITKKVDAATPKATKQDWASFVKELTC